MQSCLGIYIENNIIKYAKISKEKDNVKISTFGIKFYDNLSKAIKQVVEETFSYKTPISTNLTNERYNYFDMFAMLNRKDLKKSIDIEFESYCSEKGENSNAVESRYAAVKNVEDKESFRIIHISENKVDINKTKQRFEGYRLTNMTPIAISIPNIIKAQPRENILIVNIENETMITTILDQKIYNVINLEEGTGEILDKINAKENSYAKAYDICKNTTIYTSEIHDFIEDTSTHLEDIMPTLYNIVGKVQKVINESPKKIDSVYITGTAANINNIDLYFQEYLGDIKCEILRPYFVQNITKDMNIKDYIEVNSAISLALQGLGQGLDGMNFKTPTLLERLPEISINSNKEKNSKRQNNAKTKQIIVNDFGTKLTKGEKASVRIISAIAILILVYSVFTVMINNQVERKKVEIQETKAAIDAEKGKIEKDVQTLNKRASEYSSLIEKIQASTGKIDDIVKSKNLIPNLLNKIMFVIPEKVQVISIKNTSGSHIEIGVQSQNYEDLGYFKAKLKTDNILLNVESTTGVTNENIIQVTIEGELP